MSSRLERYLRRASHGVPSAQRTVIQAELRGNIELRTTELEFGALQDSEFLIR